MKRIFSVGIIVVLLLISLLSGCRDAEVVSYNLSKESDMFNVMRRVVFYNGITGEYIFVIEGRCSIYVDSTDGQLELTCKTGGDEYKKHFLGLSDNVTYFAEQIDGVSVDKYHYKVYFKPSVIIPNIEVVN